MSKLILARSQNTLFSLLWLPSVTINTRAVAGFPAVQSCMLALGSPAGQGIALQDNGGGNASNVNIPTVLFILPCLLMVIATPVALRVSDTLRTIFAQGFHGP